MLNFLKLCIPSRNDHQEDAFPATPLQYAPNTKIPYNPDLIPELLAEHLSIQKLLGDIISASYKHDTQLIIQQLTKLKQLQTEHFLKENIHLFVYLKHVTAHNISASSMINESQKATQLINKEVIAFINYWLSAPEEEFKSFAKPFSLVTQLILNRSKDEERQLYTAYREPEFYIDDSVNLTLIDDSIKNYQDEEGSLFKTG